MLGISDIKDKDTILKVCGKVNTFSEKYGFLHRFFKNIVYNFEFLFHMSCFLYRFVVKYIINVM